MPRVQFIIEIKTTIYCNLMVSIEGIIGKPVKIRYGPAAVIGDEPRNVPLPGTQMFECRMGRRG